MVDFGPVLPQLNEDLLRDIVGISSRAQAIARQRDDALAVFLNSLLELDLHIILKTRGPK